MLGALFVSFAFAYVIGLKVAAYSNLDSPQSQLSDSNLDDEQIKRVVGMVQQGTCDEHMRRKLLDLATLALPRLLERIQEHEV